ncbi:sensor histidine kinase [Pontibacillus halophilus JSM 076056 = DSM 19796]|uniref:histidine kinase n=1 Tax=Pontibacillus halophilus JSM 076056 = DSM 19796 TaxID=1385510 RepID=A0A0A5GN54_9BACI|nr:HAMP domain-containing sensor histidine kinase [Pontibacillus halophilus]KGX93414.1 sensor histidine kinase [Pontibacillus halophilus JSM 076056 = DSM 19796]
MKSIKRRIAFQFSIQMVLLTAFLFVILLILLFSLILLYSNEGVNQHFPSGVLESISTEIWLEEDDIQMPAVWKEELKTRNMWLQVVNEEGKVFFAVNNPEQLPKSYTLSEINEIEATESLDRYTVTTLVDDYLYQNTYLFMLGYKHEHLQELTAWMSTYGSSEEWDSEQIAHLHTTLVDKGYTLHLVDKDGRVREELGVNHDSTHYSPIDLSIRKQQPQNFTTEVTTRYMSDEEAWVLHTPKKTEKWEPPTFKTGVIILSTIAVFLFLLLVTFSVWHGMRYGKPLLLFIGWLERMQRGEYQEVLTSDERKKVFNQKNKLKRQYRLYKEVIQEFYEMAEQLTASEYERKLLDEQREQWMAGISHDLRTPLTTIHGYGYMLESNQYQWNEEELQEIGATIRKKGDYMLELIQDFSLISKLKEQHIPTEFTPVSVKELLHSTVQKYRYEEIPISLDLPSIDYFVLGEKKWLERLLDNLIVNAQVHNPPGTAVSVAVVPNLHTLSIRVKDEGVGLDEETKKHLFTRYYRGTNSETRHEGSGLGMSIAKAIVLAHNGEIKVTSTLGQGTEIAFTLPITQPLQNEQGEK